MKINANFLSGRVESNSKEAHDLFSISMIGEKSGEKIVYSSFEAFYLMVPA